MRGGSSITLNTRISPARPSCTAAFSEPSARKGREAISSAATKPVKLPIVLEPTAARQPAKPITAATAAPPSTSSTGSIRARLLTMRTSARYSASNAARRACDFRRFQPIGADRAGLGETLVQQRRGLAHALLHAAGGAAHAPADSLDRHRRQRIQRGGNQAQQPVEIQHRGDQPDHRHQIGDPVHRAGQRLADRPWRRW